MRINYMTRTKTLGPGTRCGVWMQGCKKRCKGCINPEGQDPSGGYEVDVEELVNRVLQYEEINGVTISGGEPFLQYNELFSFIRRIKELSDLDIMLFSGYQLEELKKRYPDCMDMMKLVDIFIDGEYIEEKNDDSAYKGSSNQNIYYFTDKYKEQSGKIEISKTRNFSFDIKEDGEIFFIGIPPKDFYRKFLMKLGGNYNEW